jgi:hypothetical protein
LKLEARRFVLCLRLALRLAALDRYLEAHEPMPLILDDLLITFDDDRATAILPQLADLARRTRIFSLPAMSTWSRSAAGLWVKTRSIFTD